MIASEANERFEKQSQQSSKTGVSARGMAATKKQIEKFKEDFALYVKKTDFDALRQELQIA